MRDAIEHSESIETATAAKITTETAELKKTLPAEAQKETFDQMSENADRRRQRLALTKKKKFTYLRYNRPERENPDRRDSQKRPERQRNSDDRDSRTTSERRNDNYPRRDDREYNKDRRPIRREFDREEHRWEDRHHQRTNLDGRRSRHDLSGQNTPHNRREGHQRDEDQSGHQENSTRYRDILRGSRPTSRTSILKKASATNLSRRNSHADTRPRDENPKDEEIRQLREKLNRYETDPSKNDKRPPTAEPPNAEGDPPDHKQVLEFISTTMKALEAFKIQLGN